MIDLKLIDYLFIFSLVSIWLLLLFNIVLTFSGYSYFLKTSKRQRDPIPKREVYPFVSILIPAHNEEKVIEKTMLAMLKLDYPAEKLEVIVINDNSSDKTGEVLHRIQRDYPGRDIKVITTDKETGGKGKSNALNIGYRASKGEYLAIYDADNTPEKLALIYLVNTIESNSKYGAVIGKFRTRNKNRNLLTRFINIETISFQWMSQGGRWRLFGLCTLPGTNFIIRRDVVDTVGGWDTHAIAEDTELSIRIYKLGYKICFAPEAVTWEQEPETFGVWTKQRIRWVKGNIYVVAKYILKPRETLFQSIIVDILYFFSVYFLFLTSVLLSDIVFLLGLFNIAQISLQGNYIFIWFLAYALFILEVSIALTMEKGEATTENILIVAFMYFTYCQLWIYVCFKGIVSYLRDIITRRENKWYKTERF